MILGIEIKEIIIRLSVARVAHRDMDSAIEALIAQGVPDQLQLARLKRRKLRLRDEMMVLENQLIPDSTA